MYMLEFVSQQVVCVLFVQYVYCMVECEVDCFGCEQFGVVGECGKCWCVGKWYVIDGCYVDLFWLCDVYCVCVVGLCWCQWCVLCEFVCCFCFGLCDSGG